MNSDPLDRLLAAYSDQPLPPAPESNTGIWRRIEERRRRSSWAGLFPVLGWRELFAEPGMAITALAVALLTGIVPVAAAHSLTATPRAARDSLHLDVFTTCPSYMPMNLAAGQRRR